ncbi:MAG: hypothetical protein WCP28_10315 [Actinomycetes bacterium]
MSAVSQVTDEKRHEAAPKQYGRSVLATACARYWRAWQVFLLVLVVNVVIQPLLTTLPGVPSLTSARFMVTALVSYAVLLFSFGFLICAALLVPNGKAGIGATWARLKANLGGFVVWTVAWTVVVTLGLSLWVYPGLVILILTPFVPIAAAAGHKNPFKANFQAIWARKGRFVVTLIITLAFFLALQVIVALFNWLVTGVPAYAIGWFILCLVGPWLLTAFVLLYLSTPVGAAALAGSSAPELNAT